MIMYKTFKTIGQNIRTINFVIFGFFINDTFSGYAIVLSYKYREM